MSKAMTPTEHVTIMLKMSNIGRLDYFRVIKKEYGSEFLARVQSELTKRIQK